MLRPPRDKRDAKAIDEGSDTYDTIEWLLKNVPGNNGRVGMLGRLLPGLADRHGHARPAPRAQGGLAPGVAGRRCSWETTSTTTAPSG